MSQLDVLLRILCELILKSLHMIDNVQERVLTIYLWNHISNSFHDSIIMFWNLEFSLIDLSGNVNSQRPVSTLLRLVWLWHIVMVWSFIQVLKLAWLKLCIWCLIMLNGRTLSFWNKSGACKSVNFVSKWCLFPYDKGEILVKILIRVITIFDFRITHIRINLSVISFISKYVWDYFFYFWAFPLNHSIHTSKVITLSFFNFS